LEFAIVATLPANGMSFTAIVRGANNTTGIAVVEALRAALKRFALPKRDAPAFRPVRKFHGLSI